MEGNHWHVSKNHFILLVFMIMFIFFLNVPDMAAEKKKQPKALVIYTTLDGEINEYQRSLDMLIGHFTNDITIMSSSDVTTSDLDSVTHLFYYGQSAEELPSRFSTLFDDFEGTFIAIGYNSEQLGDHFTFVEPLHERKINQLTLTKNEKKMDISERLIIDTKLTGETETLLEGTDTEDSSVHPVIVRNQNQYYYAVDDVLFEEMILFGEVLHDIFEKDRKSEHPAYIRLEDVHPLVDPTDLKEIADVLKEKDIPYMVALIPVYINPETGKEHHFSDSPELLKVLKKMQDEGGSMVLHGYTHQFRDSETGEGFEFWDVEKNTPIYSGADESFTLQERNDFDTMTEYEDYVKSLKQFERTYIENKLTKGIQEMANYGLYPLAFEAPHYTMSQHGYEVVSEYFSTYVGQIQLSDQDWEIMWSTPYITSPSFLHGMELLPETMGYVKPDDAQAIPKMMQKAEDLRVTEDGMLGAFYHPYLGVERFKELIEKIEDLPNLSWIDLKERDLVVKADKVKIYTENGEIKTEIDRTRLLLSSIDFPLYHFNRMMNVSAWGMTIIGGLAVLLFIIYTIVLHTRKD